MTFLSMLRPNDDMALLGLRVSLCELASSEVVKVQQERSTGELQMEGQLPTINTKAALFSFPAGY